MKTTIRVKNPYSLAPESEKIQTVTGYLVTLRVAPKVQFVAYKYTSKLWRIVEKSTGCSVGGSYGGTKQDAIAKAEHAISTLREGLIQRCITETEKLN